MHKIITALAHPRPSGQTAPPGVYLWDIPPESLYLAISNHVVAAAAQSLTLSARARVNPLRAS